MFKKDIIVWEIIGDTFWLVALVSALVFGLLSQAHLNEPRYAQPDSGAVMQVLPESMTESWFPSA